MNTKYEKIKARYPSSTLKVSSLEKFIIDKATPLVGEKARVSATNAPEVLLFMEVLAL